MGRPHQRTRLGVRLVYRVQDGHYFVLRMTHSRESTGRGSTQKAAMQGNTYSTRRTRRSSGPRKITSRCYSMIWTYTRYSSLPTPTIDVVFREVENGGVVVRIKDIPGTRGKEDWAEVIA